METIVCHDVGDNDGTVKIENSTETAMVEQPPYEGATAATQEKKLIYYAGNVVSQRPIRLARTRPRLLYSPSTSPTRSKQVTKDNERPLKAVTSVISKGRVVKQESSRPKSLTPRRRKIISNFLKTTAASKPGKFGAVQSFRWMKELQRQLQLPPSRDITKVEPVTSGDVDRWLTNRRFAKSLKKLTKIDSPSSSTVTASSTIDEDNTTDQQPGPSSISLARLLTTEPTLVAVTPDTARIKQERRSPSVTRHVQQPAADHQVQSDSSGSPSSTCSSSVIVIEVDNAPSTTHHQNDTRIPEAVMSLQAHSRQMVNIYNEIAQEGFINPRLATSMEVFRHQLNSLVGVLYYFLADLQEHQQQDKEQ